MALKLRLTRIGTTHQPHYRIVVAEARSRRDGAPVETLGTYDPRTKGKQVTMRLDRVDYWLSKGAKPTDTLHAMIKRYRRGVSDSPAAVGAASSTAASDSASSSSSAPTPASSASARESAPASDAQSAPSSGGTPASA